MRHPVPGRDKIIFDLAFWPHQTSTNAHSAGLRAVSHYDDTTGTMGDHGDGNIKVVVRCRPLNSRGTYKLLVALHSLTWLGQRLREAQKNSFV
jgi:hypothetical protein